ncbi:MAG: tetratricopeptide repeat protein [Dongiaceae bacterium]
MERRLAAILSADVAGYSRLMGADEEGTLNALRSRLEIMSHQISAHHGRVFNSAGDSVVAEFSSAVDAVNCAVEIQQAIRKCNEAVAENNHLEFRIGINIGDVMAEDGNLYGDGVNISSRIQELAESGGVFVAQNVYNEVSQKVSLTFDALGEHRVKNIVRPVSVYRVQIDNGTKRSRAIVWLRNRSRQRTMMATIAVMMLLFASGLVVWHIYPGQSWPSGPPTVAVLPFDDLTGDTVQTNFTSGLTDQVTTVLSTYPEIRVIARTSTLRFKDTSEDIRDIAAELGARYVIEGSVQRTANSVHVSAQLIQGTTGNHIWARPIDVIGEGNVALQQRVATTLYAALAGFGGEFRRTEEDLVWRKPDSQLDEYDYYLRGHQIFFKFTKEDMARARQIWEDGLRHFPDSPLLRIKIAVSLWQDVAWGWSADPDGDLARGWELLQVAVSIPSKSQLAEWYSHYIMAFYQQWFAHDYDRSIAEARTATNLAPYDAFTRADLAQAMALAGRTEEAIQWAEEALRLDPNPPDFYISNLGVAHYLAGQYAEALSALKRLNDPTSLYLAVVYVRLGRIDEARATMADYMKAVPTDTLAVETRWPIKDPAIRQLYLDDLRTAGMPEN